MRLIDLILDEPDFVEIYAIDMMKFAEKKRSKIFIISAYV